MQEPIDTKEEFLLIKRAKSFANAGRGIGVFLKTTQMRGFNYLFF